MVNLRLEHLGPIPVRFAHRRGQVDCVLKFHNLRPTQCFFFVAERNDWLNISEYFYSRYSRTIVDRNTLASFVGREESARADRIINLRLRHIGSIPVRFSHRGGRLHRAVRVHNIRPSNCYFFNGHQREWNTVFEYFYARYGMSLVNRNILFSFEGREELGLFPLECLSIDE